MRGITSLEGGSSLRVPTLTKYDFSDLLDDMQNNTLQLLEIQLDALQLKKERLNQPGTSLFCPKCRKKHEKGQCPLHMIEVCGLCIENHSI